MWMQYSLGGFLSQADQRGAGGPQGSEARNILQAVITMAPKAYTTVPTLKSVMVLLPTPQCLQRTCPTTEGFKLWL